MNYQEAIELAKGLAAAGVLQVQTPAPGRKQHQFYGYETQLKLARHILTSPISRNFIKDCSIAAKCTPDFCGRIFRTWKRRGWFRPELTSGSRLRCYILTERGRLNLTRLLGEPLSLAAGEPAKSGIPHAGHRDYDAPSKQKEQAPAASAP